MTTTNAVKVTLVTVGLALAYLMAYAAHGGFEKKTYADCILEHMPNAPTTGVVDIRRACAVKFPTEEWWKNDPVIEPRPAN